MSITEKISHAAERKAFETILDAMLKKGQTQDVGDLAQQLADVAAKLAEEYWADHRRDILPIVDGSFLEEYDEYNIEVQFKSTAAVLSLIHI